MTIDGARENLTLRLHDGRTLGYADYGDPHGEPVMFFHGTPSSRLMFRVGDLVARGRRIRLVAPDRPGIGLSTHWDDRRIVDWPTDVVQLADHLGFGRFSVVGISGGGPYAIACAAFIADRLTAVGIVSGMGPLDVPALDAALMPQYRRIFSLAREGGARYAMFCAATAFTARRWPARSLKFATQKEPRQERRAIVNSTAWQALKAATRESFRAGWRGPGHDTRLLADPWGFAPGGVRVPVTMWHGTADTIVPAAMTSYLAERIGDCRVTMIPGAGHFWGLTNAELILAGLDLNLKSAA